MVRHFIRLLIQRNFKRNGFHTLINILGLSIGLASFILFITFIQGLKEYDTFHENYHDIYRIVSEKGDSRGAFGGTPAQLGSYLKERVPEIKQYVRLDDIKNVVIIKDKEKFFESDLLYADNSFFDIFSFPIIQGNVNNPIEDINSVVLSEDMAHKYFGDVDPIGKFIKIGNNEKEYKVTAIVQNYPENSSIKYSFILSFDIIEKEAQWGMFNYTTYLLLDSSKKEIAENKIKDCAVDRGGDNLMSLNFLRLQPLKDMRFEVVRGNTFNTIDRKYILIFFSASIFILLLAIINYTNLASAISLKRSKEVAIKKILGSYRTRIIMEFLIESIVFAIFALVIAFILVELVSPYFGQLIHEEIQLSYSYIPLFILLAVVVGLAAGIYPSFYGSRYDILGLMKQSIYKGKKAKLFRNILVVLQFGITCFLLVCALTFSKQLDFLLNRNLGFETKNVFEIDVQWDGIKLESLKNELLKFTAVENVTTSSFTAGEDGWNQNTYWEGMTEETQINMFVLAADKDFVETMQIPYIEKLKDFNKLNFKENRYYILNESAKKYLGWDECINKSFSIHYNSIGHVAGVVKDFNFRSLHHESSPSVIVLSGKPVHDKMQIKIQPGAEVDLMNFLRKKWKEYAPVNAPLITTSLSEDFENLYAAERKTKTVIILFTIVALFISMLGLFGLATFITLQRTKEIGIRKANGANIQNLIFMLVAEFVRWVLLALIISVPVAFIYLKSWLQNFSYQTQLSWWVFAVSGLFVLFIAFLSVIVQSYRASLKNPVESLRYE
ncbi:MAG: ABC transporter permease [Bacteroidetes bacterium]|nr:ABC transporter permease [Bacteroidota bacterium]